MIYIRMDPPDFIALHYHGRSPDEPCEDMIIPSAVFQGAGTVYRQYTEEEFKIFSAQWEGRFTIVSEMEMENIRFLAEQSSGEKH